MEGGSHGFDTLKHGYLNFQRRFKKVNRIPVWYFGTRSKQRAMPLHCIHLLGSLSIFPL